MVELAKETPRPASRRPGFAVNTLWTWASVIATFAMALFVAPLMIRRLGDEAYGLWTLVFSLVEYYSVLDLGIRSAVVKYVAQHTALGEEEELNKTLNTALVYFVGIGAVLLLLSVFLAPVAPKLFVVSEPMRSTFVYIVLTTGCAWAVGIVFVCVSSSLEAIQRFDITSKIGIATSVVRVVGIVAALQSGYGLRLVVTIAVVVRLLQCALLLVAFHQQFPAFRWRWRDFDLSTFRKFVGFSIHTVTAMFGSLLLAQGPGVAIGHALPARFVGYYSLPGKLVQAALDLVFRLGLVTTARTAELVAHGRRDELVRLGVGSNRYALVVFMPAALFLLAYGDVLLGLWITPEFARLSAPLLPLFVLGILFSDAMQFNSGSMLFGLARHQVYGWLRLIEGVASFLLVSYFARRGDLWSAAAGTSLLMICNRGIATPLLLCFELRYSVARFLQEIVARPMLVGLAVGVIIGACRLTWLPGQTLAQIAVGGVLCLFLFTVAAGRYCVIPDHQLQVVDMVHRKFPLLEQVVRVWFGIHIGSPSSEAARK